MYIFLSFFTGDYIVETQRLVRSYIEYIPPPLRIPGLLPPESQTSPVLLPTSEEHDNQHEHDKEDEGEAKGVMGKFMRYMEIKTEEPSVDI